MPDVAGVRLELMYFSESPTGVRFGGFDGAAGAGAPLQVSLSDDPPVDVIADADGRFEVEGRSGHEAATLEVGGGSVRFRLRMTDRAHGDAVGVDVGGAGQTPNDLVIPAGADHGLLVRSGDDAVSPFDFQSGLDSGRLGVRLPQRDGLSANPWFVAPLDVTGTRVAVTAVNHDRVYEIDFDAEQLGQEWSVEIPVQLETPFALSTPFDVDGDGTLDTEVTAFAPSFPQPVLRFGENLLAGYTSFRRARLDPERGPVMLPGAVAIWDLDSTDLQTVIALPFLNPQELRAIDDRRVLVVCSGMFDDLNGTLRAVTEGGLVVIDVELGQIEKAIPLLAFAPGTAVHFDGVFFVGSLTAGQVSVVDPATDSSIQTFRLNDAPVDSVFRLVELGGGLLGVPSFNTDRLHVLDMRTRVLDPAPFFRGIAVGPGADSASVLFDGLQIVARRSGRSGVDYVGPDLFALTQSSIVRPIYTRSFLGP